MKENRQKLGFVSQIEVADDFTLMLAERRACRVAQLCCSVSTDLPIWGKYHGERLSQPSSVPLSNPHGRRAHIQLGRTHLGVKSPKFRISWTISAWVWSPAASQPAKTSFCSLRTRDPGEGGTGLGANGPGRGTNVRRYGGTRGGNNPHPLPPPRPTLSLRRPVSGSESTYAGVCS